MRSLRWFALAEAITLLTLIFIAVPLKYAGGIPEAVSIMGPVHGVTFLVFLWLVVRSWSEGLINSKGALRLFVGAMIPFGGILNERWLAARKTRRDVRDL
jgi:integral membrane protein